MRIAILVLLLALGAASASPAARAASDGQEGFTPAPVPKLGPALVPPSERAGGPGLRSSDTGPANATPFSSAPSGTLGNGDQVDQHTRETTPGEAVTTPNLSR